MIKTIHNEDIKIYGVIFCKTVIGLLVLYYHIAVVFLYTYSKFWTNIIVTRIVCYFATNHANLMIFVSLERGGSSLSKEKKIVGIG